LNGTSKVETKYYQVAEKLKPFDTTSTYIAPNHLETMPNLMTNVNLVEFSLSGA